MTRSRLLLAILGAAFASACQGRSPGAAARAAASTYTSAEINADRLRMESAIREGDAALHKYRTPREVDSIFGALADSTAKPMTAGEFWRVASIALAGIHDDHLSLAPSESVVAMIYTNPGRAMPIVFAIEDGHLFVYRDFRGAGSLPIGTEITGVNHLATSAFVLGCESVVPTDKGLQTRASRRAERDFESTCALSLGFPARYIVDARLGDGTAHTFEVTAIPWQERRRLVRANSPRDTIQPAPGGLTFLDSSTVAVLTLQSLAKSNGFDPERLIDDTFEAMRQRRTRALVIDLRDNTGGRDGYAAQLFRRIARDTFTYYTRRDVNKRRFAFLKETDDWFLNYAALVTRMTKTPTGHYTLSLAMDRPMKPDKDAFAGSVTVLVNGNSVSTSSEFASVFRARRRGLIVGEESGSAETGGTGAAASLVLSNTRIIINVPLVSAHIAQGPRRDSVVLHGVIPDVIVKRSIAERLSGHDAALDSALAIARRAR